MTGTDNLGLTPISSGQAQKEVTANENFEILASAIAGSLAVAMADANQTLTDAQVQQSATFLCTGALTADRNLIVPIDVIRIYDVANNTTGSHNIVVKTPSGTGITIPAGGEQIVRCDGTNVVAVSGASTSAGTVTSVATGTGLTGGPITGTGTLSLATVATLNVLANITGGTAAPIANTLTALIDAAIGSTQGVILYRGASAWSVLSPGTTGQFLETQGASANPKWASPGASSPRIVSATSSSTTYTADWSAADEIRLTLASATVAITNSGAVDGQKCVLTLIQDGTGGRLATWGTESDFGAAGTAVLSSAASARDHLGFLFNNTASKYDAVSFAGGF